MKKVKTQQTSEKLAKQKTPTTMERIDRMEQDVNQLKMLFMQAQQANEFLMQKATAVEQSYASLAKTVTALVAELVDKNVVDDHAVMSRIRDIDEKAERERVQAMLKEKIIKTSEEIGENSLVAIKQAVVETDTEKGTREKLVANYRLIEMGAQFSIPEVKERLKGLRVGNTIEVNREEKDGVVSILNATVLEIYDIAQGERVEGEGSPAESKEAPENK